MAAGDDDQISAKLHRARHGHGASHTQRARRVRTGCDHAAFVGFAAHGEWSSAQGGVMNFLHRAEEGVEINVQDRAGHGYIIVTDLTGFQNLSGLGKKES